MTASTTTPRPRLSMPRLFLHAEGLAILAIALVLYGRGGYSWWTFLLLLLTPDLAFLFHLAGKRIGNTVYNIVHTYIFPVVLALVSANSGNELGLQLALIWLAHIGMDRAVGYGFKYPDETRKTHFSVI